MYTNQKDPQSFKTHASPGLWVPFWVKVCATGSLPFNARNLETGISAPQHQIYHVTSSYGKVSLTDFSA